MEHYLTGKEGRLCDVDNEHQCEVTMGMNIVSATWLAEESLSMKDVIFAPVPETSL